MRMCTKQRERVDVSHASKSCGIFVDLLSHEAAGREAHLIVGGGGGHRSVEVFAGTCRLHRFVARRLHRIDGDLQTAVLCRSRELLLGRVARPKGHRHELPDQPLLDAEAVQPRLPGNHEVVLRPLGELVRPRLPGQRVDLPGGHLDGHRIASAEAQPHRLGLVHREEGSSAPPPLLGQPLQVVVDVAEREPPQARRQGVGAVVVRDAQRALESDLQPGVFMHLGEPEYQTIIV